jgi:3-methyl-2-oxobutanoate hydroxymethyltransferase
MTRFAPFRTRTRREAFVGREKVTVRDIATRPAGSEPLTMITAYDHATAVLADAAGVDLILVGDTLGIFALGHRDTIPVTMDDMVHHCRAVSHAQPSALVVGDMPFGSYQGDPADAVGAAVRLLQEGRCQAVKLEGGRARLAAIEAIVAAGIPVMGHVGLVPQSSNLLGGNIVQGQTASAAQEIVDDARAVEGAGCFAVVVEAVPRRVAREITAAINIPTIGIGAGPDCDGQVLVFHEVTGMHRGASPRFVKRYAEVGEAIVEAISQYCREVRSREFPSREHSYLMSKEQLALFSDGEVAAEAEIAGRSRDGSAPRTDATAAGS